MAAPNLHILPARRGTAAWWPIVLPLALMLASDYKLRTREVDQAVGGSADLTVLIEIVVYGMVAAYVYFQFGLRLPTRRISGLLLAGWAWAAYVALSALWTPYHSLGIVRAAQLLITMTVAHIVATRAAPADLRRFAHAFIVVVVVSVGIGVAHPFPRTRHTEDRFNWLFVHPVIAGVYLALAVLLVLGLMLRPEGAAHRLWPLPVYGALLAVLVPALVATGTRGAALGCAVGVVGIAATVRGAKGRLDLLLLGVAGLVVAVLGFAGPLMAFIARGETAQKLATLNSRTDLWALAMKAFAEEPVFGRGLGASRGLFLRQIGLGGGHNAFINALVDNGVVGTVIFTALLVVLGTVLCTLIRRREIRSDAGLLIGILVFFLADGMTTEGLAAPANVSGVWLFVLIAWTETLRRDRVAAGPQPLPGPGQPDEPAGRHGG